MNTEIIKTANPQKTARSHLLFLLLFCPVFLGGSFFAFNYFNVENDFRIFFFICATIGLVCGVFIMLRLISGKGSQEWRLSGGRLIYKSPSSLLGASFDVAWDDVVDIYTPDEGDFARCDLVSGSHVEFHIGERSGWEFFKLIRKMKAEQQN